MSTMNVLLGAACAALAWPGASRRMTLSRAKHPSLTGHARIARTVARWIPRYEFDEQSFFDTDDASLAVQDRRRAAFEALARHLALRHPESVERTKQASKPISDLQFTSAYRVPFPFGRMVQQHLPLGQFFERSEDGRLIDLDGESFVDLAGSYGVNLLGHEFYKRSISEGVGRVDALGPVLGPYHPVVLSNAQRLCSISRMDEVSFHMSGTEAVMQAVRLARFHTRRSKVVRFCGAYHGWWDDVQPGVGSPITPGNTFTLKDMHEGSLRVLRQRRDIACVLINPLQALHPNQAAPGDSTLVCRRSMPGFDREGYAQWLRAVREICAQRGIVFILDEVFMGFRLAVGGAQQYFGVLADLVTYGKTLGGGLPVGVLCGRAALMRRFRDERPVDVCFARGTFNSHPYVMGAMSAFLDHLDQPATRALYDDLDSRWQGRAALLNQRLAQAGVPVRVAAMSSVWTVCYPQAGRYHWLLQYYLREQGIALSWVGTGRLIFSLDCSDSRFEEIARRFVAAALAMKEGGWWEGGLPDERAVKRRLVREMVSARFR